MIERQSVRLSQGTVAYRDSGGGRDAKPGVVFVHGLLVAGSLWTQVAERLGARGRCIVPDWPLGSHRLPMDEAADLSPGGMATLVADPIEKLDLHDVTLVGNDSGGAVCQLVAARHAERIGRLVLTDCDVLEAFPPPGFGHLAMIPRIPGLLWLLAKTLLALPRARPPDPG